jgi:putative acetyltransferase
MQTPVVRREAQGDEDAIRDVTRAAFDRRPYADGDEHELVDRLRSDGALAISLVAEVGGRIVGHVAFSPAVASDGSEGWFALGPVSVAPGHQRSGIGSSMIRTGLRELERAGAAGCILTGDPKYYGRFGFERAPAIAPPGQPAEYFQVKVLAGPAPRAPVHFHEAFAPPSPRGPRDSSRPPSAP